MTEKPVLVVMAAGMGSRYGGLKQIDPVGSHGEAILDYSLYDAYQAGFRTAVIIIKKAIYEDFMEMVGNRLKACPMEIRYAYQELDKLPEEFERPADRQKPWGTTHALLCAADEIGDAPFAVVNADDYYGKSAYRKIYKFLSEEKTGDCQRYCMVGYRLKNTVTEHGSVARAVCVSDENGYLQSIVERKRIETYPGGIHFTLDEGRTWTDLDPDSLVSMNLWGLERGFLRETGKKFPAFLREDLAKDPQKAEFLLPTSIGEILAEGKATVRVLCSDEMWYGVTYAQDKPVVMKAIHDLTARGLYPADGLWSRRPVAADNS